MSKAIDKKALTERDICSQNVLPAIKSAGWDLRTQIREEVTFTDGRILLRGTTVSRGKRKRADIILYHKPNIPVAIIEVKDNTPTSRGTASHRRPRRASSFSLRSTRNPNHHLPPPRHLPPPIHPTRSLRRGVRRHGTNETYATYG